MVDQYDKMQKEGRGEDSSGNRGIQAMSDMKKRLEAFRKAKKVSESINNMEKQNKKVRSESPDIIEVNDNTKYRWDNTEALEERSMTPVELFRKYLKIERAIITRGGRVYFRELSFAEDMKTNLKISRNPGEETDYYSVGCLAYFIRNIADDHPEYVRKCICDKIPCVRRVDRDNIKQYLYSERDFILNLVSEPTSEYGGNVSSSVPSTTVRNDQRSSREKNSQSRMRSRSRSRERRRRRSRDRRSEDRNRRRRTRSRSRERRSRSPTSSYDPSEPTITPNKPGQSWADHRSSGFDHRQSTGFDQRPELRPGGGFDQRPTMFGSMSTGFDQRISSFDGRSSFDHRLAEHDDRSWMTRNTQYQDQQNSFNNQLHGQRSQDRDFCDGRDGGFINRESMMENQEHIRRENPSFGNQFGESLSSGRGGFGGDDDMEYDNQSSSNSMFRHQKQAFNFERNQSQLRNRNITDQSFINSRDEDSSRNKMIEHRQSFYDFRDQESRREDDKDSSSDTRNQDANNALGPMFVIGQNNSNNAVPARRW